MSFAADAIGFYIELENNLSPELEVAAKDYERFTKSLDKWNTRAYKAASKGFGALTNLVESFEALPKKAVKSYNAALSNIKKAIKPITQPLVLELSPKAQKGFARSIARSVSEVLSKVKIRLTATAPIKKSKFFDTSVSLRAAYKQEAQPPDMLGAFQGVPRFQKGGVVPGPGGIDEILALLSPGEAVLPADVVKELQTMAGDKAVSKGLADALSQITNIATAAEKLKDIAALGLDPKAQTKYNKAMSALNEQLETARDHYQQMTPDLQRDLVPALKKATQQVQEFGEAGEDVSGTFEKLLKDILGPTRFMAIHKALGSMQEAFGGVRSAASDVGDQLGMNMETTQGFMDNMFDANLTLRMSREEVYKLSDALVSSARAQDLAGVSTQSLGEAFKSLVDAQVTDRDLLKELTPVVAQLARATGVGSGSLAETMYKLTNQYQFTTEDAVAFYETIGVTASQTATNVTDLTQQMQENLKGGLGAFLQTVESKEMRQRALTAMSNITAALAENWQDEGGQMAQTLSKALTDVDAFGRLRALIPVSQDVFRKALTEGGAGATKILGMMADNLARFRDTDPGALQQLMEALEYEGDVDSFMAMIKGGDKAVETARKLETQGILAKDSMNSLTESVKKQVKGFDSLKDSLSLWFTEKIGGRLTAFFEDFNPQVIVSTGYLVKMGAEATIAGAKLAVGFGGVVLKVGKWVGGLVGLFGKTAKGLSTVATGAGAAAKAAKTGGFLAGLASGITALAPALTAFGAAMLGPGGIGLLALVGALIGIAYAAKTAAPAIFAIGKAIGAAVTPLFDAFKEMSAGQIATTAASLLLLGPAFVGLGAGILAMSASLALSGPGLLVFAVAMLALAPAGGVGGLKGMVVGLLDAFQVDKQKLDMALAAVTGTAKFIVGLVGVSATLAGLAVGSAIGTVVSGVLGVFGVKSPMQQLVSQAQSVVDTVRTLVTTFNFTEPEVKAMRGVSKAVSAVAVVIRGFSLLAKVVAESGRNIGALAGGVFSGGAFTKIAKGLPKFRIGVVGIVEELGRLKESIGSATAASLKETIDLATIAVVGIAKPVAAIEPLAEMMKKIKESAATVVTQRGPTIAAIKSAIRMGEGLKQEFARPVVARAELEKTIMVELDPNTTDQPVHDAIIRSNEILAQIAEAVKTGGVVRFGGPPARARARGVDEGTLAIASGGRV